MVNSSMNPPSDQSITQKSNPREIYYPLIKSLLELPSISCRVEITFQTQVRKFFSNDEALLLKTDLLKDHCDLSISREILAMHFKHTLN